MRVLAGIVRHIFLPVLQLQGCNQQVIGERQVEK